MSLLPTARDGRMPQNGRVTSTKTRYLRRDSRSRRRRAPTPSPRTSGSRSAPRCTSPGARHRHPRASRPRRRRRRPASIVAVAAVLVLSSRSPARSPPSPRGTRTPAGSRRYVRLALGATAARMTGYWFFFGVCVGAPVVAMLGGEYVVAVLGVDRAAVLVVGVAFLVAAARHRLFGLRVAGWVQLVLTGAAPRRRRRRGRGACPPSTRELRAVPAARLGRRRRRGQPVRVGVRRLGGGTHIAGEFRDPRRTIPLATAIALVVVGVAYLALQYVTVTVLGEPRGRRPRAADRSRRRRLARRRPGAVGGHRGHRRARRARRLPAGVRQARRIARPRRRPAALVRPGRAAGRRAASRARCSPACSSSSTSGSMLLTGLDLEPFVLVHTSCMVAIYALGMVAAVRLLDRWSPAGGWPSSPACSSPGCSCSRGPPGGAARARRCGRGGQWSPHRENEKREWECLTSVPCSTPWSSSPTAEVCTPRASGSTFPPAETARGQDRRAVRAPPRARDGGGVPLTGLADHRGGAQGIARGRGKRRGRAAAAGERRGVVDLSHPIRAGLVTYPGLPAPRSPRT